MKRNDLLIPFLIFSAFIISVMAGGCAQVGMPTGGLRDSLAPVLAKAAPGERKVNFTGNRIVLTFDEYVEIQEVQQNVLVSPLQKNNPDIRSNLKTVTVKLKDTLRPNTTYSINFGNSIKDVNEGNVFKNYTYVFSTGNSIDSLKLSGKVLMAETGLVDTTLNVLLYRDATDSAVQKIKPDYIARVNRDGSFNFTYLPGASFRIYALKDGDGGKFYNTKAEAFAFRENNEPVNTSAFTDSIKLFAYVQEKQVNAGPAQSSGKPSTTTAIRNKVEKKLKFTTSLGQTPLQELFSPLQITFNNPVKSFDEQKIFLADTNYNRITTTKFSFDSTRTIATYQNDWVPEMKYRFVVDKTGIEDSAGNFLSKTDTLKFTAKRTEDYGRLVLRFSNLELSAHPVLQILQGEVIKSSYPLTSAEWKNNTFVPGDYGIRILYDKNSNGIWDPGNYTKNLQPEIVVNIPLKISIRANWDNERDIKL